MSMAAIAVCLATTLHEGVGHGVTAWLRGDVVTQLTSNHLSSVRPDRLVDAGGTLANLVVGFASMMISVASGKRANQRYFFWIFGALNLLSGAGYFLFSGALGVGDWDQVIAGSPHYVGFRVLMVIFGAVWYVAILRLIAMEIHPFLTRRRDYNRLARLAYCAACATDCVAGAFDPMGVKLLLISTIPAVFGGFSGLLWADVFLPKFSVERPLIVKPSRALWVAAIVIVALFVGVLGRGVEFRH
ncbi:MAG TPA: hypothetical protein VFA99_05885 [Acidobacteriaceae bacterium]|nr:hypothetical protein [Acidobacteriaceae bacterium]